MTFRSAEKMICPKCGFEMNHHSDKLVHGPNSQAGPMDGHLGGFLEEFHACPNCGAVASRPAGAT
jgi:ribosomal protein S27AE